MNIALMSVIAFGTITAQILLKKGLLSLGKLDFSSGIRVEVLRIFHSPYVVGALLLQGIIVFLWIYVLSRTQLVHLFTITGAFVYILLALVSWIILGETLTSVQWIGVILISLGVVCFNWQFL